MTPTPAAEELYVSVDIEAAGPVPGLFSMLSLGACVVGAPSQSFYVELRPINNASVPEAIRVARLSMDQLLRRGQDPAHAMADFGAWVRSISLHRKPVFVAFNNSFDWSFVNWYFHRFLGENPFGIGGVDIKAYYMGMTGCAWSETTWRRLPESARSRLPKTHNALDDARAQAETFSRMLARSPGRPSVSAI